MTTIAELNETIDRFAHRVDAIIAANAARDAENAARDAEYKAAEERRNIEAARITARMDEDRRKTDEAIRKSVNRFDKNWGNLVESFVHNQVLELFAARGIPVTDDTAQNVTGKINGKATEIDLVLVNTTIAVIIEVKTTLNKSDVDDFVYKLKHCRCFKMIGDRYETILGGIAYIRGKDSAVQYAQDHGLFAILATGKSAKIVNADDFQPQKWGNDV